MSRISKHEENSETKSCKFCGASETQLLRGVSCIWRDEKDDNFGSLRPEPSLRIFACEDGKEISKRILELKLEKDLMINHQEEGIKYDRPDEVFHFG